MSDEMAVSDNVAGDEDKLNAGDAPDSVTEDADSVPESQSEEASPQGIEEATNQLEDPPESENTEDTNDDTPEESIDDQVETNDDDDDDAKDNLDMAQPVDSDIKDIEEKMEVDDSAPEMKQEIDDDEEATDETEPEDKDEDDVDSKRGIKRKMSEAFSDTGSEEFKGFDTAGVEDKTEMYSRIVERLEAEVTAATKDFVPLRVIMGTPTTPVRASKRPRKDTDGSRPSSAMSSRSDETTDSSSRPASLSSPAQRGRRSTTEMSSPLLRVPLERGWRRELVYRAALDTHSRRNADIYYYSPKGKKLRSTREVAEHLAGTGLTLENFSFFKEPLGVDDPEKEIIRDAKLIRRVESPPAAAPAPVEGKRTPKPKPPKGASPEPTPKSPPAKIKVKSVGTRLSGAAAAPVPATKQQQKKPAAAAAAPTPDNNNSSAWKKPRAPEPPASPAPPPHPPPAAPAQTPPPAPPAPVPARPPPVQTAADVPASVPGAGGGGGGRGVQQPCSMSCGRGAVPSLACAACLCLYHPACVGLRGPLHATTFLCKNCRKSSSPPLDPPALVHKSGVPPPRRPAPTPTRPQRRVLLRMKAAGSAEGERVWSVASSAPSSAPAHSAPSPAPPAATPSAGTTCVGGAMWRGAAPQSLAVLNGRRFVVVPRSLVQAHSHT